MTAATFRAHALERQAITWLVRLQSHPGNLRVRQDCDHWRGTDPAHEQAWQAVQHSYGLLRDGIRRLPAGTPGTASGVLDRAAQRSDRRRALARLAALMVVSVPTAHVARRELPWQRLSADYATATGARQEVTLPDGTRLWLNTDSAVRLRFEATQRLLLLDRGEILLASGPDAGHPTKRPLRVQTDQGVMEALGTRFSVRLLPDHAPAACRLGVEDGAVRMLPRGLGAAPVVATAGQTHRMTASGIVREPSPGMDLFAWTQGLLVVHDLRLAEVLAEVRRYRPGHLGWAEEVADLRVSGTYRLDDTGRILDLLAETLPLDVVRRTRYWTSVRRAPNRS